MIIATAIIAPDSPAIRLVTNSSAEINVLIISQLYPLESALSIKTLTCAF